MNGPNPVLMHYYGNEELYKEKLAREQLPEDMVRLASIAAHIGADLAKSAGIGGLALKGVGALAKSPTARGVLGGGALVGGGLLAAKAMKKVPEVMGQESGAKTFGSGRFGYNPPGAVNEYGVAAPGSPIY
jgi:hypothetical protein